MAEILPFRAVHYDPAKSGPLDEVVTQPYDKISAEMQAQYYARSGYNLVRIIRGRVSASDDSQDNVYSRAARDFHNWIQSGVLVSDAQPALYPYYQEYFVPRPGAARKQRRGFIALLRLEDYTARVVHRHEETLSGPKADRLQLLNATRAHFGQIFMLYSDPAGSVETALGAAAEGAPWERVKDEYGADHLVWRATDPKLIQAVSQAMRDKKLIIADGHHRYETALAFRDASRAQGEGKAAAEHVMVTLVRMETEGLTILPTHRLVHSLPDFDWDRFTAEARRWFEWESLDGSPDAVSRMAVELGKAEPERRTIGVYAGRDKLGLLRAGDRTDFARSMPDLPPTLARLDVVVLHRLILEQILGIDRQAVADEKNVRYARELDAALKAVDQGEAQISFLMRPTPVEAVRENAFRGHPLPQKSTDFYPKLLSGLAIYWLDNPAGI